MRNLKNIVKVEPSSPKDVSYLYVVSDSSFQTLENGYKVLAKELNTLLKQMQPETFDCLWIQQHASDLYGYISENIRNMDGSVDWDSITVILDKKFQKRWHRPKVKNILPYENKGELDAIMNKFQNKLYTLLNPLDEQDKNIRDLIFINLVRIAQKGNMLAKQQIVDWLTFVITEWIESRKEIAKWKGFTGDLEKLIEGCIRCYRYTGTFIGYVYKTLQYAGRGLHPLYVCSLNDRVGKGTKTRIDYVIQQEEDAYDSIR